MDKIKILSILLYFYTYLYYYTNLLKNYLAPPQLGQLPM